MKLRRRQERYKQQGANFAEHTLSRIMKTNASIRLKNNEKICSLRKRKNDRLKRARALIS
jgi:hypothetical protein